MNELVDTFSNRLNTAMRIRNLKPVELSEKTGIDKSKISSYMSGQTRWSIFACSSITGKRSLAYGPRCFNGKRNKYI